MWTARASDAVLELDRTIYSLDAILRSAYKFGDRCQIVLQPEGDRRVRVCVAIRGDPSCADALVGELANDLIDQELRGRLEQQFGGVRALIVAQAFAEGNLLDSARDEGDYHADPRGAGRQR